MDRTTHLADILDSLVAHGRPIVPVLKSVGHQFREHLPQRRIAGATYHFKRLGGVAVLNLTQLLRANTDVAEVRETLQVWEDVHDALFTTAMASLTKNCLGGDDVTIRDGDFYALRVGRFLRGLFNWPFPLRPGALQTALTSCLKNLPAVDPNCLQENNPEVFSYLDQLSHLFGKLSLCVRNAMAVESQRICGVPMIEMLTNSNNSFAITSQRSYSVDNPIFVQLASDLKDAVDRWRPIIEPIVLGEYDHVLDRVRSSGTPNASPRRKKKKSEEDEDDEPEERKVDLVFSVPVDKLFQLSATSLALIAFDLMSNGFADRITPHTELQISQLIQKNTMEMSRLEIKKHQIRLRDAG